MRIPFVPSQQRSSLGLEWEISLIDRDTQELSQSASILLADLCPAGMDHHPYVKHEFMEYTLEAITQICTTVRQAIEDLSATIDEIRVAANKRNIDLCASGTHPFSRWRDQQVLSDVRYQQMIERQQDAARKLMITGVHTHVGVTERDTLMPILNATMNYLPHILAISASSPYWQGEDTGFASSRVGIFDAMSTAGLPPIFQNWGDYESTVGGLIASESIDPGMRQLWWDIRPNPNFGTIEIRAADCLSTFDEVAMVAALSQCLIDRFAQQLDEGYTLPVPKGWIIRENKWRAARYGLDAQFIINDTGSVVPAREAIMKLVEDLTPTAERLGCATELTTATRILSVGASYERQRAVAAANGGDLTTVVEHLIAEMRDGLISEQRASNDNPRKRR